MSFITFLFAFIAVGVAQAHRRVKRLVKEAAKGMQAEAHGQLLTGKTLQEDAEPVTFMQFNIRVALPITLGSECEWTWLPHGIFKGCSDGRKKAVEAHIKRFDPDILGTQEGTPNQIYQLAQLLNNEYAYIGQGRKGANDDETSAIFYKHNDWDLEVMGDFMFSDSPHSVGTSYAEATYPMINTWAVLVGRSPAKRQRLLVVCTHLDPYSLDAREKSGEQMVSTIADLKAKYQTSHEVILGDFNAGPTEAPLLAAKQAGFADAYEVEHGHAYQRFTWHDWKGHSHAPAGTGIISCAGVGRQTPAAGTRCSASDGDAPVDFVLFSPKDMEVGTAEFSFEQELGMWPSDHWALVAKVSIPPSPSAGWPGYEWIPMAKGQSLGSLRVVETRPGHLVGRLKPYGEAGEVSIDGSNKVSAFKVRDYADQDSGEVLVLRDGAVSQWVAIERGGALPLGALVTGWTYQDLAIHAARAPTGEGCKLNTDTDNSAYNIWCRNLSGPATQGEVLVVTPPR